MSGWYNVQKGECVSSIAFQLGYHWETLWNDPSNSELKATRKNPNVLSEGDRLFIPRRQPRMEDRATEAKHTFVKRGVPAKLKLRLMQNGKPRANIAYMLIIDGNAYNGQTDSEGRLEHAIPPNASLGELVITIHGVEERRKLVLGDLDPLDTLAGVKDRLVNLGYDFDKGPNSMTDKFRSVLMSFQFDQQLSQTGELDDQTRQKLQQLHGF